MQNSTRIAIGVVVVCAIALIVWSLRPRPIPDTVQIARQLKTAVDGANQHSVGAIMSVVSPNYQDNYGLVADSLRSLLQRRLTTDPTLAVAVSQPIIQVHGNTATTDCTVTITDTGSRVTHPLHLEWKKEKTEEWLLFPTTVWRVVSADAGDIDTSM